MTAKQYGIPMPTQFDRLYAGPLDKHEVFDSYSEALVYAQGSISYPGQVIGVKKSGLKEDVYVINQDKSLSRLMIQRDDIRVVLYASKWTGEVPHEQIVPIPYLEATDNCIISLGEAVNDPEIVREIVNAKIADTIQEDGRIRFIARGDTPKVDIPITITIASVVSAVEIPNNVNDNTNHTVVIAKKDEWKGDKPPYTQDLYVFGVRPDSNGTIGINPDSSYAQINKLAASTAGVVRYEQKNNCVTIAALNSKPTRDLEVLVIWGDEIVVFENSDTLEDFNTSVNLVLKANEWTTQRPYTQTLTDGLEGLSEYHTGAIGLSDNCTPEEAEIGLNAGLKLIKQGNGYIIVEASDIKPNIDIPIYLTYGSNITIVPSPEYVGEANRHVDTTAYASKWVKVPDGWQQEVDVEGITSNSIGTMGLRNGATSTQGYVAGTARIKITKVYDNKVLLTATKTRPVINLPLCFVFGRNINVAKYPGIIGKVSVSASYILFDDSLINSKLTSLQELLEYLMKYKLSREDIVDSVHDGDLHPQYIPEEDSVWKSDMPLSARMGRYLYKRKINYDDIINDVETDENLKPLSAKMGKYLNDLINTLDKQNIEQHNYFNKRINEIQGDIGNTVIKVQSTQPASIKGKNIVWIKTDTEITPVKYTILFNANGGTGAPATIIADVGNSTIIPSTIPVKDGYTFLHWTDGVDVINANSLFISSIEATINLSAVWEPKTYTVTLNDQNADKLGIGIIYYKYKEPVFYSSLKLTSDSILTDLSNYLPEKEGYEFTGYWKNVNDTDINNRYINDKGIFKIIQDSPDTLYNIIGNSTIYAGWNGSEYTITFKDSDRTLPSYIIPISENTGIPITIPSNYIPTLRTGYKFLGWSDIESDIAPKWKPGDIYAENKSETLYAVWEYIVYTIDIKSIEKNDEGEYITSDILYYRYNENVIYSDEECTEATVIIPPEKEGAIFDGYYDEKNGKGNKYINNTGDFEDSIYTLGKNLILYPYFEEIIYTIDFDTIDGIVVGAPEENKYYIEPLQGTYNEIVQIPNNITLEKSTTTEDNEIIHFKFMGWKDYNVEESEDGSSVKSLYQAGENYTITQNNTLYAEWDNIVEIKLLDEDKVTTNEIIYNIFETDEIYSDLACTNRIYNINNIPTKEGYNFLGYYATIKGQTEEKQYIYQDGTFNDELFTDNKDFIVTLIAKW